MRTRLPDRFPTDYSQMLRNQDAWPDHQLRVAVTASILHWMNPRSVLDPACGDGSVVATANLAAFEGVTVGDISEANIEALRNYERYPLHPIEFKNLIVGDVFDTLAGTDPVDTIVLTEIVEHVEDPVALLRAAHEKAERLLVSSPEMRPGQVDRNPEHLWMFDGDGYEDLLNEAGWKAIHKTHLTFRSDYNFQIWVCDRG